MMLLFAGLLSASLPAAAPDSAKTEDPAPLIIAVANDSLAERVWLESGARTDKPTYNEVQAYATEHSVETLAALKKIGITFVVVPYGGHGSNAYEQSERSLIRDFAQRVRSQSLGFGIRLPIESVNPSHWASSQPADAMLLRDMQSHPIEHPRYGESYTSVLSPGTRRHIEALLAEAVRETKPDIVLIPDLTWAAGYEPPSRDAFLAALRASTRPAAATELGTKDFTQLFPLKPDAPDGVKLAWMKFRQQAISDELRAIRDQLRHDGHGPSICIDVPLARVPGSWLMGPMFDAAEVLKQADFVWTSATVQTDMSGRVQHAIASLKAISDSGCRPIAVCSAAVNVAETLAFGMDPGVCMVQFKNANISADTSGRVPFAEQTSALCTFFREHYELYRGARRVADAVLLRPSNINAVLAPAYQAAYVQTESALVAHRIPFSIALDPDLPNLRPDQVLVLAGAQRLNGDQIRRIQQHVRAGGGIVLIGGDSQSDDFGAHPILTALDGRTPATQPAGNSSAPARSWTLGHGRIAMLDRPGPIINTWLTTRSAAAHAGSLPSEDEFASALRWAAGGHLSLEIFAEGASVIELARTKDEARTLLHHVNLHPRTVANAGLFRLRLPPGRIARTVQRFTPDTGAQSPVTFRQSADVVSFDATPCNLYELYVIDSEPSR